MAHSPSQHDRTADSTLLPAQAPRLTRRRLLTASAALAGAAMASSAAGAAAAAGTSASRIPLFNISRQQQASLVFTYWGSPQEQKAVADMTKSFNDKNPGINVKAQYVAIDGYRQKLTTMLAGEAPPDVAYQFVGLAFDWAVAGKTLDLTAYVKKDPESVQLLPNTTYTYNGGKEADDGSGRV